MGRLKRALQELAKPGNSRQPEIDLSNIQVRQRRKTPLDLVYEHAVEESFELFKEEMQTAMLFRQKPRLRAYCLDRAVENMGRDGLYVEFGVWEGKGLNAFARRLSKLDILIHGFDSLQGLEEDWLGHHDGRIAGDYSVNGKAPVLEANARLRRGWVQDTLPGFLDEHPGQKIAFAHVDMDTYTPTAFALAQIKPRLVVGSVPLFDELYGYPGWRMHEYKALKEVLPDDCYRHIGFSIEAVGIEIVSLP